MQIVLTNEELEANRLAKTEPEHGDGIRHQLVAGGQGTHAGKHLQKYCTKYCNTAKILSVRRQMGGVGRAGHRARTCQRNLLGIWKYKNLGNFKKCQVALDTLDPIE